MADAVVLNQMQKECVVEKHEIDSNSLLHKMEFLPLSLKIFRMMKSEL